MDAFYASVEQRDNPELAGKPLVVGGRPDGRGVVATASYEARVFGIRSAMSSRRAFQLCPHAIFVYPRFEAYKEVSRGIRAIFARYTDIIEPLSLDEAFLDVTDDKLKIGSAIEIAKQIKQAIRDELHLTASAGVSSSKFVAKIASDMNKPDGLTFIAPTQIEAFMEALPVEKFFGVGKVTAGRMKQLNIHTGADMKKMSEQELIRLFGKSGRFYYNMVRGIDNREVRTNRIVKSLGAEDTFSEDLDDETSLVRELDKLATKVHERLEKRSLQGRTLTLKVKFQNFKIITRNTSFKYFGQDKEMMLNAAISLLSNVDTEGQKIRLLGITISNFVNEQPVKFNGQLSLF